MRRFTFMAVAVAVLACTPGKGHAHGLGLSFGFGVGVGGGGGGGYAAPYGFSSGYAVPYGFSSGYAAPYGFSSGYAAPYGFSSGYAAPYGFSSGIGLGLGHSFGHFGPFAGGQSFSLGDNSAQGFLDQILLPILLNNLRQNGGSGPNQAQINVKNLAQQIVALGKLKDVDQVSKDTKKMLFTFLKDLSENGDGQLKTAAQKALKEIIEPKKAEAADEEGLLPLNRPQFRAELDAKLAALKQAPVTPATPAVVDADLSSFRAKLAARLDAVKQTAETADAKTTPAAVQTASAAKK